MGVKTMETRYQKVKAFTESRIRKLLSEPENAARASLARLRKGIGHAPGELPDLWGEFLTDLPEEFCGCGTEISREEWAIYTALTVFALHQQGKSRESEPMHRPDISVGSAAARLIESDDADGDRERVARRFYPVATAEDMTELSYKLRSLVTLLRAKGIPMDYARLAADLYRFQNPDTADSVKLRWGEDFSRIQFKENEEYNDLDEKKGN